MKEKLFLLFKLIRPNIPLSGGLGTWIIAQLCGASLEQSFAAALSIAFGTIGASFYHYGGANWMYTRKSERFKFKDPEIIRLIGLGIFSISICIAAIWLSKACVVICVFNTFIIAAYSAKLSSHWLTKNFTMSVVSVTPILMGWQAGTTTNPMVFWAIALVSIAHMAREIIKDVEDILANEGRRITLPMVLGTKQALQISGGLLLIATALVFAFLQFTHATFVVISAVIFLLAAIMLLTGKQTERCKTLINVSIWLVLFSFW